jgi:hypothetical protein
MSQTVNSETLNEYKKLGEAHFSEIKREINLIKLSGKDYALKLARLKKKHKYEIEIFPDKNHFKLG